MADRKVYKRTLDELTKVSRYAIKKTNKNVALDDSYAPEDYGYNTNDFYAYKHPENLTQKEANKLIKEIRSFNQDRGLNLTDVGDKKSKYITRRELKEWDLKLSSTNKYHSDLLIADALGTMQQVNIYRGKFKGIVAQSKDLVSMWLAGEGDLPILYKYGDRLIGAKGLTATEIDAIKQVGNIISLDKFESVEEAKAIINRRNMELIDIKNKNLKGNYLKAVEHKFNEFFAKEVSKALRGIDTMEFLFLFNNTEALRFGFVYDERIQVETKVEAIKSTLEAMRKGKIPGFKEFSKVMKKYIPKDEQGNY